MYWYFQKIYEAKHVETSMEILTNSIITRGNLYNILSKDCDQIKNFSKDVF